MKRSLILTASSFLVLAQLSLAQMPQTINYQGVLKDNSGNIVADGGYDLTFRLYDTSTGGTEWWSETHVGVQVTDGIFNVILGSTTSFRNTVPKTKFDIPYWLEIAVGASTLPTRIQLTAVPYSIAARNVHGYMNVFPSKGNVGIGTTTPGAKLLIQSQNADGIQLSDSLSGKTRATLLNWETMGGQLSLKDVDGATQAVIRGYATVDGYQASFTAGNVGIGTGSPEGLLHITRYGGSQLQLGHNNQPNWEWYFDVDATANMTLQNEGNGSPVTVMAFGNNQNVGIGTTNPTAKLEVVGGIKADSIQLATAADRWYAIPAPEFRFANNSTQYSTGYYTYTNSPFGDFYAPVHLPHGATITGFEFTITDDVDTVNAAIYLYSVYQSNQSTYQIASLSTAGHTATVTHRDMTLSQSVDNENYAYMVQAYWAQTGGPNMKIHNARIRYTVTSPLP